MATFDLRKVSVVSARDDVNFAAAEADPSRLKLCAAICYENEGMEKIDPQPDHVRLAQFNPGQQVIFQGKPYTIQRRTTLASGEAAVVLQDDHEQFVISAAQFLAGLN